MIPCFGAGVPYDVLRIIVSSFPLQSTRSLDDACLAPYKLTVPITVRTVCLCHQVRSYFYVVTCNCLLSSGEKLQMLKAQKEKSQFVTPGSLTEAQFNASITGDEMASVTSPVPVVGLSLHIQTVEAIRSDAHRKSDRP